MNIALAHDYLLVRRGAERSFLAMTEIWPEAPIFTLLYNEAGLGPDLSSRDVRTSHLQRLPVSQASFRRLLPLFPHAVESLDLEAFDLVVSSSSAYAHGVRTRPDAIHLCYCYTPFRYAWYEEARALHESPAVLRPLVRRTLKRARHWDVRAARRVTHYVAISELSRERIRRYLGRDASVVHPPVELSRFAPAEPEDFFLVVCELVRHKQVEVALEAARASRRPIKVVGGGPDAQRLQAKYGDHAEFLGRVPDQVLADLYARCRALVLPNVEEFGIAAVEAQAAGRPVLAVDAGGARETVVEGRTGSFVAPGDADAMARAMTRVDWDGFDADAAVANAHRFSRETFQERLRLEVERVRHSAVPSAA